MIKIVFIVIILISFLSQNAKSENISGIYFSHKDWEIACDNTGTCKAAGYQSDDSESPPVSVLLTRKAGPNQPVTGELMIGHYDDKDKLIKILQSNKYKLTMKTDGNAIGQVVINKESFTAALSNKQVNKLIKAVIGNSTVEWTSNKGSWGLSGKGATAVLLKMDDFQRRVGTTGALVKKGTLEEHGVLPAKPVPVVMVPKIKKSTTENTIFSESDLRNLESAVKETTGEDDCYFLHENKSPEEKPSIIKLTDDKLLVSTLCWRGAYNEGYGYWVVNNGPPFHPLLVTTNGSVYDADGTISAYYKGRGLGDCLSSDSWVWDGRQFRHIRSLTTGMCKFVAPGGAWTLPTIVTEVRYLER